MLLNVSVERVFVKVKGARRLLLAGGVVVVEYETTAPDTVSAELIKSKLKTVAPNEFVAALKAEGLSDVLAAVVYVSDDITPVTQPPPPLPPLPASPSLSELVDKESSGVSFARHGVLYVVLGATGVVMLLGESNSFQRSRRRMVVEY